MSFSQGSVILQQKRSAGGPVTAGARNGTSIVSGYVELGGTLLHATDIDFAGFVFTLSDGLNDLLSIDPVSGQISIGDLNNFLGGVTIDINQPGTILFKVGGLAGTNFLDFNDNAKLYQYGDLSGAGNQSVLLIDDNQQQLLFSTIGGSFLNIDFNNGLYQLGDISGTLNSSKIVIDDSNAAKSITYTAPTNHIWQVGAAGATEAMRIKSTGELLVGTTSSVSANFLIQSNTGILANAGSTADTTNINPQVLCYASGGNFYGFSLLYQNSRFRTALYAPNTDVGIGTIGPGATLASNFTEKITVRGDATRVGINQQNPTMVFEVAGSMGAQQGADVASTNNLVLGTDGNAFEITGTTQINLIANTGRVNGGIVNLIFTSNPTVKNGQATSGSNITILLAGAADFVASSNDVLTLMLCEVGGTQAWREVCRSVN